MRLLYPFALLLLILVPLLAVALRYGRRRVGTRRALRLFFRALLVIAATLAVAGMQGRTDADGVDVVFVVDVSDSVDPQGSETADRFVRDALSRAGADDRAAIVLVGDGAVVERELQPGLERMSRESILGTGATALAEGLLRAISQFDDGRRRRIVLLSDGGETRGDAAEAARLAASAGIEVSAVPLRARAAEGGVFVRALEAPAEVRVGEAHEFRAVIASAVSRDVLVSVFRDGYYYGEDRVRLGPGDNVVGFRGSFEERGVHRYRVVVSGPGIPSTPVTEAEAFVRVVGEPAILYVAPDPAQPLLAALRSQGFTVETRSSAALPGDTAGLAPYDAIIFDNVPAHDLSLARMEAVERYVRDTGGGFVMIGGDASFGAGGYYRTPIERLLPVDMDVTSTMRIPSLAMLFVVDKSGSMGAMEVTGLTRLDLVKEAVVSAVEVMNPFYRVGVIAFDADFEWAVAVTTAGERERIVADLARLVPGGGTVLGPALREALLSLRAEDAAVKHVIVLSDGLTSDSGFDLILDGYAGDAITVSAVSVGSTADREQMRRLAEWGGGRSYHAADSRSVPRIFATETTIVSRNLIVESPFIPRIVSRDPIVEGIGDHDLPPLEGFVLSYLKPAARLVLSGTGENPLLATQRYGLGRSVAFTSDLRAKWAARWLDWEGYPRLVAQLLRWVQRPAGDGQLTVRFNREIESTRVIVDALSAEGGFRNLLDLSARVVPPDGVRLTVALRQTMPGRYEASIPGSDPGPYLVTIVGDGESRPEPYTFAVPYPLEHLQFETDYALLQATIIAGGGLLLGADESQTVFTPGAVAERYHDGVWRTLLVTTVLLLIVELVVSRLVPAARAARSRTGDEGGDRPEEPRSDEAPSYAEMRRQVAEDYRTQERQRIYIARNRR